MATTMLLSTYYRPAIDGECFFLLVLPRPLHGSLGQRGGPGLDYGVSWPARDDIKVCVCVRLVVFSAIVFSSSKSVSSLARVRKQIFPIQVEVELCSSLLTIQRI